MPTSIHQLCCNTMVVNAPCHVELAEAQAKHPSCIDPETTPALLSAAFLASCRPQQAPAAPLNNLGVPEENAMSGITKSR